MTPRLKKLTKALGRAQRVSSTLGAAVLVEQCPGLCPRGFTGADWEAIQRDLTTISLLVDSLKKP